MEKDPIYAIGDVHGCANELARLIDKLDITSKTTVVFLGDYVDRGPDSKGVIDLILKLRLHCKVITLMGNHEMMFMEFIKDPSSVLAGFFILNGGSATLASYLAGENNYDIPESHLAFLEELKTHYQTENHFFVHAGLPDVPISELNLSEHLNDMLWIRRPFHQSQFPWSKQIVHGHTPVSQVDITKSRINVDTGCVFNGALTAVEVNTHQIFQVFPEAPIPKVFLKANPSISRVAARFSGTIPVFVETESGYAEFLTVNYNEFGMLILEQSSTGRIFEVGQILKGKIGASQERQLTFAGQVMRHQGRGTEMAYGIKMIKPPHYA